MTPASLISNPHGEQGIRAKVPLKGLALEVLKVLSLWVPDRSQSSELSSAKVLMRAPQGTGALLHKTHAAMVSFWKSQCTIKGEFWPVYPLSCDFQELQKFSRKQDSWTQKFIFFSQRISYLIKVIPSPYRCFLTYLFRPSQLSYYHDSLYKQHKYLYDDICQHHLTDKTTKVHLEMLPLPIISLHLLWDFLAKLCNNLFTHKKLKSYVLLWHLLQSKSLLGPVSWVSSITRWNSRPPNLTVLSFMGPLLRLQATSLHS